MPNNTNGLPENKLAQEHEDSLAARSKPIVLEAIDKANADAITELDTLIAELTRLKTALQENAEAVKEQLTKHFALGAEAMGFTNLVRERLTTIGNGNRETAQPKGK